VIAAADPLRRGRDQARGWASEELARREYQAARPSLVQRVQDWLADLLDRLPRPHGYDWQVALAVALVIVAVLAAYVLWRAGGVHRRGRAAAVDTFTETLRSADDHRAAADRAEAAGDWSVALVERFRAVVVALADRGLLDLEPGRTADDLARRAGARLPSAAARLLGAAGRFDDVRYGGHAATAADVRSIADLDADLARTRPEEASVDGQAGLAIPR
jgi:type II secretory pathway pseudopilin PulG